jgi:hypothetical protein
MVYVATATPLCEMPLPAAMARRVVVVDTDTGHGLEQDGDEIVGNPVVE